MVICAPILATWLKNRYQVTIQDFYVPVSLALVSSFFLSLLFFRRYKEDTFAALLTAALLASLFGHDFNDRLTAVTPFLNAIDPLPDLHGLQQPLFNAIFIFAIIVGGFLFFRLIRRLTLGWEKVKPELTKMVGVVIVVTFALLFLPTAKALIIEWPQFFYRPPQLPALPAASQSAAKPDIYYIVLDRYASQNILQDQLSFNNSAFIDSLTKLGFYSNPNAHQNYPYTTMSISSTLNANYQGDVINKFSQASEQIIEPYHDEIRYSSVVQQLKSIGYTYYELGNWYETSNQTPLADVSYQNEGKLILFNQEITLNNFSKLQLIQSVFWQFISHGIRIGNFQLIGYSGQAGQDQIMGQLATLKQIATSPTQGGRLIFAHILVPHDPYYFNADGSLNLNVGSDNLGEPITEKYTNQVQFINTQMQSLLSEIKQNSNGKAVVILQSDEGPYPIDLKGESSGSTDVESELASGSMLSWSDSDLQMKFGNLAAYDVPAASPQELQTAGDSVNIFRLILNKYFGDNLPYLPKCYYAYPNGRGQPFVYQNINQQLTGQSAPLACSKDGT